MRASTSLGCFLFTGLFVVGAACGGSSSSTAAGTASGDHGGAGAGGTGGVGAGGATISTSSSSGILVDAGPVGAFPFPRVTYQGGPLLTAPNIVSITFPGDTLAADFTTFGASLASSSYWDTIRAGYCGAGTTCIGDGPAGTTVSLTTAPAASFTDSTQGSASTLKTFLEGLITAGTVPAPDANTVYALYFPQSVTVDLDGSKSCKDFYGYHGSLTMGTQEVFYAVDDECAAPQTRPTIDLLQNTTVTSSHEAIEASSDPSSLRFSYFLDLSDQRTFGWADVLGGEIGDLCVDPFGLGQDETTEDGFTVQRIWSATQAAAGKNPCVPVPAGEVYFNAFPRVSAVVLDVGDSATIEVDALADGPMGEWTMLAEDWSLPIDPSMTAPFVTFAIAGGTSTDAGPQIKAKSGDRIQLTVTLVADPGNTTQDGEADAVLVSANGDEQTATAAHLWPFIVLTPTEAATGGVTMMKRRAHAHRRSRPRRPGRSLGGAR